MVRTVLFIDLTERQHELTESDCVVESV